ncbi:polymeric immunoglobulin receptor-like [Thunnus albacares]|uniref:polymeric immunoglobulin receptor-like n=1 Tax=Thunnus albacares TaxID=8236 RepID=UPI001CF709CC|nr:polymeric immunoglobulin receptor-like [Thunnus albacares]
MALSCSDQQEIKAKSGDDVTLPCQSPRDETITVLEWSRPDLKTDDYVFFFRDDLQYESYQLPSFHGRVQLRDPEMKDGDVSVILKNVTINDTGTYRCRVSVNSTELMNTIYLTVSDSDQQEIKAKSGDDVTLPCQSPRDETITVLEWSRPDLKTDDYVFFFRDDLQYESYQLPSFHGRVQLRDPEMKDGDVSVILKNITINDTGTYKCRVSVNSTELMNTIYLTVSDSGHTAGNTWTEGHKDGGKMGRYTGVMKNQRRYLVLRRKTSSVQTALEHPSIKYTTDCHSDCSCAYNVQILY